MELITAIFFAFKALGINRPTKRKPKNEFGSFTYECSMWMCCGGNLNENVNPWHAMYGTVACTIFSAKNQTCGLRHYGRFYVMLIEHIHTDTLGVVQASRMATVSNRRRQCDESKSEVRQRSSYSAKIGWLGVPKAALERSIMGRSCSVFVSVSCVRGCARECRPI